MPSPRQGSVLVPMFVGQRLPQTDSSRVSNFAD